MKRVLTALVLLPLVVWIVLAGPQWSLMALMAAVGLIAFHEFDDIAAAQGVSRSGLAGLAAGLVVLFVPEPVWVAIVVLSLVLMALELRQTDLATAMTSAAVALLGVIYIFGAWRCALALRLSDSVSGPHWLMIAGALLVGAGSIGLLVSRRKSDEVDPPPDEPIDLPALPLLNSKSKNKA